MDYFSWEFLVTYSGMTAFVAAFTQIFKRFFPNYDPKWVALACAVIGQAAVQILYVKDFSLSGIVMAIFNVAAVLCGSVGAYEIAVKPVQKHSGTDSADEDVDA